MDAGMESPTPMVRRGWAIPAAAVLPWSSDRTGRRTRAPAWLWLPVLAIGCLALLPLVYLVIRSSDGSAQAWQTLLRPKTVQVLANTLLLVGAVSVATTALALPLAWLTVRTDLPGRRFWSTALVLPLVVPSYVGALALVAALGPRGLLQQMLEPFGVAALPSIYGFWGAWLALTLFTLPFPLLSIRAALAGLDPSLEEAARSLGMPARAAFWRVTVPRLRPAIGAGGLLVALYTIGDFGVVSLLRYDSFARAIYTAYRSSFDRAAAALLALALLLLTLVFLAAERRVRGRATLHRVGAGSGRRARDVRLGRWRWPALALCAAVVLLALGLPLVVLAYWALRFLLADGEASPYLLAATRVSFALGLATAVLATLAALPVAILRVRFGGRLAVVVERIAHLTYALPGIVLAIAFVAISVRTPWYQTFPILVVAFALRFLPQAVGAAQLSLLQINPRLEDAARGLGRSFLATLWQVTVPLARPGVLAGALLVLLTTMKELPITLLLLPTGARTLPTLIWTNAADARYGEAALPALLLVALTSGPAFLLARREHATI